MATSGAGLDVLRNKIRYKKRRSYNRAFCTPKMKYGEFYIISRIIDIDLFGQGNHTYVVAIIY